MEAYICLQYDAYQNWFWGKLMEALGALHYSLQLQGTAHEVGQTKHIQPAPCDLDLPKSWEQYQGELLPFQFEEARQPEMVNKQKMLIP